MRARRLSCLTMCLLTLAACSPDTGKPAAQVAAARSHVPTQADVDRFLAEGPEPTLQALRPLDFWLQYKMMQATGIEQALGGETQAIAALQALGDAYERKLRSAEANAPKLIPAAFTGEGMASGLAGLGMGAFAGMMTGGLMGSAISSMSDKDLAELVKAGPIKFDNKSGNAALQVGEDGSLTQSLAFDVNENGLNGKVKMKIHMDGCPDPEGKVTVNLDVDSSMSVSGKPGTGGHVHTQFSYERYLDNDAHLISGNDGGASNMRIQIGGAENFIQQQVEITTGHERSGKATFIHHNESGFSIFHPEEVERTQKLMTAAELLNTLVAEAMLRGMGVGSPWESGHCVKLDVTSDPGKRKGIRPNTAFDIEAKPRAKADGAPVGGTVTATLSGGSSLQPASGKVPADAKYQYAGPDKKDQTASIAFEARSKRGVGKASLEFDTKMKQAYRATGGIGDDQGIGNICDLGEPFTITGGTGVTRTFTPSSQAGGSFVTSGSFGGVGVHGTGTYTVNMGADEQASALNTRGSVTTKTPVGNFIRPGPTLYTLTPIATCEAE